MWIMSVMTARPTVTNITEADLTRIEAYCAAATPGPWNTDGVGVWYEVVGGGRGYDIADCEQDGGILPVNPEFIAQARTDLPALVAYVRELREALGGDWILGTPRSSVLC
jgi:hypothetical protein